MTTTPGHLTRRERTAQTEQRLRARLAAEHDSPGAWLRDQLDRHRHGLAVDDAKTALLRMLPRYDRDVTATDQLIVDALAELTASGEAHLGQYANTAMILPGPRPDTPDRPNWQPQPQPRATLGVDTAKLASLAEGLRTRREKAEARADRAAATSERVRAQGERAKGLVEQVRARRDARAASDRPRDAYVAPDGRRYRYPSDRRPS